jgi:multidrug efflux pump
VLDTIFLRSPATGEMVQLSNVVKVTESVAPKELRRFNQLRSATIDASLTEGYSLGAALAFFDEAAAEILPENMLTDYKGQSREFQTSSESLTVIFGLALCFIFLVLAAQFESFKDPIIILITVPFSITGALAALYYTGGSLNVYSQIGLVTLIGLISKHGILIVEFANQIRMRGLDRIQAVEDAAVLRLRPILMTTGAMVLGAVPLAIATGAGAESRQQIGWVVVGGMLLGTLMTLFVLPTVYSYLSARVRRSHEDDHATLPHPHAPPHVPGTHPAE